MVNTCTVSTFAVLINRTSVAASARVTYTVIFLGAASENRSTSNIIVRTKILIKRKSLQLHSNATHPMLFFCAASQKQHNRCYRNAFTSTGINTGTAFAIQITIARCSGYELAASAKNVFVVAPGCAAHAMSQSHSQTHPSCIENKNITTKKLVFKHVDHRDPRQ